MATDATPPPSAYTRSLSLGGFPDIPSGALAVVSAELAGAALGTLAYGGEGAIAGAVAVTSFAVALGIAKVTLSAFFWLIDPVNR